MRPIIKNILILVVTAIVNLFFAYLFDHYTFGPHEQVIVGTIWLIIGICSVIVIVGTLVNIAINAGR